jgi:hypothetical protein
MEPFRMSPADRCVNSHRLCMCLSVCVFLYVSICMCLSVCVCMCLSVCVHLSVSICMCLSVCVYLYVSICMCLSVCVYLYVPNMSQYVPNMSIIAQLLQIDASPSSYYVYLYVPSMPLTICPEYVPTSTCMSLVCP